MTERAVRASTASRFDALDGCRALAAVAVVVFHTTEFVGRTVDTGRMGLDIDAWTAPLGNFAVCVFFLLSGFLLYRPFAEASTMGSATPALGSYLRRRALRIFPGYWLAFVVGILLLDPGSGGARRPDTIGGGVAHGLLLQTYSASGPLEGLSVAWTLCVELSFYLALPLIAWAITRLPGARSREVRHRFRAQVIGLGLMVVLAWGYRLLPSVWSPGGLHPNLWLPNYLDWFALGMALAVAQVWRELGCDLPHVLQFVADRPWLSWLFALEVYWVGIQLQIDVSIVVQPTLSQRLARVAVNGLGAAFVLLPATLGRRRTAGLRALGSAPLAALGTISYGIYLWHTVVLRSLAEAGVEPGFAPRFAMTAMFTVVLATVSWFVVERPAMTWRFRDVRVRAPQPEPEPLLS